METNVTNTLTTSLNSTYAFELFKKGICLKLKELGDIQFLTYNLETDTVMYCYKKKWYSECFYLLALLDYLSRLHKVALCTKYDFLRKVKLSETVYLMGTDNTFKAESCNNEKEKLYENAIPEFLRHNIVELDIRDVVRGV